MNVFRRRSFWLVLGTLICVLLVGAAIASAQSTPPPIPIGQNQSSILAQPTSTSQFALNVTTPQNLNVEVLATSLGFAPAFRVFDLNNAVIFDEANATAQNIIQDQVMLTSPGTYIVEVHSANNTAGQFTISIQPGDPLTPPTPLPLETLISATVDPQNPRKVYSFTALTTDALFVEAASTIPTSGPVIRLVDANTGEGYGLADAALTLGRFRMPIGTKNYLLEVTHSGSTFPETVNICLWPEHGQPCAGVGSGNSGTGSVNPTPVPTQSDCSCQATAISSGKVGIYSIPPSLPSLPTRFLPANTPVQVIGETPDHVWIEISYNGMTGWVRASDVTLNNFCDNIPTLTPTPPATPGDTCTATAKIDRVAINIRQFPLSGAPIVASIQPGTSATVLGHTPNGLWLKVEYNGILGWVLAAVVNLSDNCDNIPVATPPPDQLPTIPPRQTLPPGNPTNTPQLPPPPQPTVTQPGPCLSLAACPSTPTPRFQLQPMPSLTIHLPTPTPTRSAPR